MMDPAALIVNAPPEWIPWLVLAALLLKAWTSWVNRKKMTVPVEPTPTEVETPTKPDVKG